MRNIDDKDEIKRIRDDGRTLFEDFWIIRDENREKYAKVRRSIPAYKKFIQEQLGWRLISNEKLIKLEKVPVFASNYMGITEFQDKRDYCILAALLAYLEDREDHEQFLLSELIAFVEMQLKTIMDVDWNSFSQRKSLYRAVSFAESCGMLKVYDGNSSSIGQSISQEVLYENTGISRYFAVNFGFDISGYSSYRDFERDMDVNRINRVYRQLALCPAIYRNGSDDVDMTYIRNARQWIDRYMGNFMGGHLDIHKNSVFWMVDDGDTYGLVHMRDAMLPEIVALVCSEVQRMVKSGELKLSEYECIELDEDEFDDIISQLSGRYKKHWNKEYRELEQYKLIDRIKSYMKDWMMLEQDGAVITLFPAVGKIGGFYPEDI